MVITCQINNIRSFTLSNDCLVGSFNLFQQSFVDVSLLDTLELISQDIQFIAIVDSLNEAGASITSPLVSILIYSRTCICRILEVH